jgi:hypothetical protein
LFFCFFVSRTSDDDDDEFLRKRKIQLERLVKMHRLEARHTHYQLVTAQHNLLEQRREIIDEFARADKRLNHEKKWKEKYDELVGRSVVEAETRETAENAWREKEAQSIARRKKKEKPSASAASSSIAFITERPESTPKQTSRSKQSEPNHDGEEDGGGAEDEDEEGDLVAAPKPAKKERAPKKEKKVEEFVSMPLFSFINHKYGY